jgi:hypothetical protein
MPTSFYSYCGQTKLKEQDDNCRTLTHQADQELLCARRNAVSGELQAGEHSKLGGIWGICELGPPTSSCSCSCAFSWTALPLMWPGMGTTWGSRGLLGLSYLTPNGAFSITLLVAILQILTREREAKREQFLQGWKLLLKRSRFHTDEVPAKEKGLQHVSPHLQSPGSLVESSRPAEVPAGKPSGKTSSKKRTSQGRYSSICQNLRWKDARSLILNSASCWSP